MKRRFRLLLAATTSYGLMFTRGFVIKNVPPACQHHGLIRSVKIKIEFHSQPCMATGNAAEQEEESPRFVFFRSMRKSRLKQRFMTVSAAAALFAAVLTSPITMDFHSNNHNDDDTAGIVFSIQKHSASAMTENQQFVSDVWSAVTVQYFDPTFNGLGEDGWRGKKKEAIQAVADTGPEDEKMVVDAIQTMLSALGDPYTRYLPREKFEALTAYATGGSSSSSTGGIGVQLLQDLRTHNVLVMKTTDGPAAAAGIRAGDVILEIDGETMESSTAEVVAAKLRGEPGEKVEILIGRGNNANDDMVIKSTKRISLTRAKIKVNPVEDSIFVSSGGKKIGLLKVPSFSTETASQIVDSLRSFSVNDNGDKRIEAIAIDLRGNVGGYMPAGVDAAKLFLPPKAHIITEVGKSGATKVFDSDGVGAETTLPVYLLVDQKTASAAEIFAAALQDNQRAMVVGTTKTFGKGRIQNVQPLENGSAVAVTKARYVTPSGRDLHGVGIEPNQKPTKCEIDDSALTCLTDIV